MLDEMKEASRSEHPGTVVKKRSSSGCLIIKKKVTGSGFSDSSSKNLFKSSKKKKRRRVGGSDSEPIDDQSETIRQKSDKLEEFGTEKRVSNGLDVFEFDEYDGFDEGRIRKDANGWKLYRRSGDQMESGNGMGADIGSDFHYDNTGTMFDTDSSRRPEMEDDESDLPLSVLRKKYRLSLNKPIRLQGKNGVLKVMVNNNKQMGVSLACSDQKEPTPRFVQNKKLNVSVKSSDHRDSEDTKFSGKPAMSKRKEKGGGLKSKPANSRKDINENDTLMQLKSCSREKVVKNEGIISPPTENATRVKGKVKRGSGTEKQLLREKIKNMLFAAGWTIDYRPRRNRDYLDAVYINPAGTAYWSIIKAYEALQKEEEDNSKAGGSFTPLADEILGKLTRQTRKKMEREMKKKRKNEERSRNAKRAKLNEESDDADSDCEEEKLNSYVKHSRKSKKSSLEEASQNSDDDSSENSYDEIPKNDRAAKTTVGTNSDTLHGRKSRKIGRCTLLVRSSDKGPYSENERLVTYSGKRTLLSWLIDSQVVHMSEHVQYMNRRKTRIMQKGWITKDGIHCGCCSKILPVLKFELHAGSKLRQPFPNIYLQSGKSLMQCQIDAWNKQGELEQKGFYTVDVDGDDPNDDTCGLCGDGGDLICCDGCPSTFHQSCLDIQMLPQGDWHCPNCSCKYCQIDGRNCDKNEDPLFVCCLCQKKYHESCRPEKDLKPIGLNLLFCEQKCQKLHSHLQKLFGVKHELDSGFSWSLIHRSDTSIDASSVELSRRVECNSMLAVAMSVMDECFLPIAEKRSGTNLIRNVVFNCGSNVARLNYSGFCTAILERGDEILCSASIRIHGTQLAEMPFIGTRHIYRRQGMCRRLLSAIESALSSLEVEKLIIPAIAEHMHTWTDVFGFHSLEESHKQEMRSMNMLVFPGTDMLQKPLVKRIAEGNKIAATDSGSQESCVPLEDGCSIPVPVSANKSELVSSSCGEFSKPDPSCKTADVDSHSAQVPDVTSHATVSSDILCEPQLQLPVSFDSNVSGHEITTQVPAGDLVSSVVSCEESASDVEEITVQNGDGTNQLPVSFDSNVSGDEITTQVPAGDLVCSVVSCDPGLQVPGKESVSDVEEITVQNGDGTNQLPLSFDSNVSGHEITTQVPAGDLVSSVVSCEPKLHVPGKESVSDVEEIAVQNGDGTNLLLTQVHDHKISTDTLLLKSDHQVEVHLEKESFSSVNGCDTTNNTTDVISLEDQAPNAPSNSTISSDSPCESQLHCSGKHGVKDMIHISETKQGSCESEMNTKEKGKISL